MTLDNSEPVECDREPIHLSGQIQSYGVLIALQEPEIKILQISENVVTYFGIAAPLLLGETLDKLLSKKQTKLIYDFSKQENLEANNPFDLKVSIPNADPNLPATVHRFNGILHRNKSNILILELEPYTYNHNHKPREFYYVLQSFMADLRQVKDISGFAQLLTNKIRQVSGFDRVMVYQFDPINQSGQVIAENKESHLESQGHFILDLGDEFMWFRPSKTKISDAWNGAFS